MANSFSGELVNDILLDVVDGADPTELDQDEIADEIIDTVKLLLEEGELRSLPDDFETTVNAIVWMYIQGVYEYI